MTLPYVPTETTDTTQPPIDWALLSADIKAQALSLGFQAAGISDIDLFDTEPRLLAWLENQYHGEMKYMEKYGVHRARPEFLLPNALRVIMVRLDYLPDSPSLDRAYQDPHIANISRYAHHQDYHVIIRDKLRALALWTEAKIGPFGYRAFADSAPIMEKPLAIKAGLGWMGKHTNIIHPKSGSWFFLGSLLVDIPLVIDPSFEKSHCGTCQACIDICPTRAIVAPFQLDARRCISYLTIELKGSIPLEFRRAIGNRIYGCDDCQKICPWNKFARVTQEIGFQSTRGFDQASLLSLFAWTPQDFKNHTQGSPIQRIGYDAWIRNIAIGLGNAPYSLLIIEALQAKIAESPLLFKNASMVIEHLEWALQEQCAKR